MNRKLIGLALLLCGMLVASGCASLCGPAVSQITGVSEKAMSPVQEARNAFQKATLAGAKKCAPVQYATAEAYLALVEHEIAEKHECSPHLFSPFDSVQLVIDKSLEAIKVCEKPPAPPAPPAPTPPAPPKPAPPAPPPPAPPAPPAPPPPPPPPPPAPTPPPPPPPPPAPPAPPKAAPQFDTIYFDVAKSNISPTAAKALDRNGMLLKDNPNLKVEIAGHTDADGSAKANQAISEKRAMSAKKYIQDKFNIPDSRISVKGYGSTKPIADNTTKEGRAKNRRVEFIIK